MAQVIAVGLGFVGAILLVSIVFLATGRGGDADTIWVFPVWVVLFVFLIWRSADQRQALARGLAVLGFEMLALPVAWLIYERPPSLAAGDAGLGQALSILALGLVAAAALFSGSFLAFRRAGGAGLTTVQRAVLALAMMSFAAEALYAILLWVGLLKG
ncbi:MAG: hypothetical protein Q8R28_16060 [Dehalococcoidia bacterium]|nr:hypothetical protein [Dehalococcoidia bacterium]